MMTSLSCFVVVAAVALGSFDRRMCGLRFTFVFSPRWSFNDNNVNNVRHHAESSGCEMGQEDSRTGTLWYN